MNIIPTQLQGAFICEPKIFSDARGYFFESFSKREFEQATGFAGDFVQDNQAKSRYGVLRGLHFQKGEHAQAKLLRAVEGRILDIGVDIRKDSPTFGRHIAVELSAENFRQLFLPRGFAHGYVVLSETAIVQYKTDNYYCPSSEGAIIWNDPDLAIDWVIPHSDIILSDKDRQNPPLRSLY